MPKPLPPSPAALLSTQILGPPSSQARTSLAHLLTSVIRQPSQYDWEKLHQYIEARLNNLYFRSKQYLSLSPFASNLDLRPSSDAAALAFTSRESQSANPFLYDYILPIFAGDVLKLASVLATRAPNLKAIPYIPGRPLDASLSRVANRGLSYLRSHWDLDAFLNQTVLGLCNSGTQFSYVQWETSNDLYGSTEIPGPPTTQYIPDHPSYYECFNCGARSSEADHMEFGGRCRQCEAPLGPETLVQSETVTEVLGPPDPAQTILAPNGAVSLSLESILTVDVPFYVKSPELEDCPWLRREYESLKWSVARRFAVEAPELLTKLSEPSRPPTETARFASDIRQSQYSPSGYRAFYRDPSLWLTTELWLTPDMYEAIPKDTSGTLREQIQSAYPNGLRVAFVNSQPVALYGETLRRHWSACKPSLSEGIYGDPLFSGYRQGCEVINTCLNMVIEALEHMPGEVMFDKALLDSQFLEENAPKWGSWIGVKFDGRSLSDHVARLPGSEIKEGVVNWMEWYFSKLRETVGITPALFGGGGGPEKTARQTEIERNQALQQHLLTWNNIRRFIARTGENGLDLLATKSNGSLFYRTRSTSIPQIESLPEITLLVTGGFKVFAEESFPQTPGQRSDSMKETLTNPVAPALLSIVRDPNISPNIVPQNLPILHETLGIEGLEMPDLDYFNLLMETIQQLLQAAPMPPMLDQFMQPIGPPTPSIQPDLVVFPNVQFNIDVLGGWYRKELSQTGSGLVQSNEQGLLNVRAYLESWMFIMEQQMMAQAAQQAAMAGAGGLGGEGGSSEESPSPGGGGGREGGGGSPPPPSPTAGPPPIPNEPPQPPPPAR